MSTSNSLDASATCSIPMSTVSTGTKKQTIPRIGLGGWAIGGPFRGDGVSLGYGSVNDAESERALHTAVDRGIRFFDTAAAYGAGHSERLLGAVVADRDDVIVATKIGIHIDENERLLLDRPFTSRDVPAAIESARSRLGRDCLDIVFLHLNTPPPETALAIFDALDEARGCGYVSSFGWSTDIPGNVSLIREREGFVAVQHALNVLFRAPRLLPVVEASGLLSVARSPLAMGILSGKYQRGQRVPADDVRASGATWCDWFDNGCIKSEHADTLERIRECLECGGRTLVQGALAWLWALSPSVLPVPGFKTSAQVSELAGALEYGPLDASTLRDIENLIDRRGEDDLRPR